MTRPFYSLLLSIFLAACTTSSASAQIVESAGSRALGMGGAFVAVANDSSATWWNPAGLAAGPFIDVSVGWGSADIAEGSAAEQGQSTWVALGTPPLGLGHYRLKITDIAQIDSIAGVTAGREDGGAAEAARTLNQLGGSLVHTVVTGLHVGGNVKYMRLSGLSGDGMDTSSNGVDLDIGMLGVRGPLRLGAVVRNVLATELGSFTLPRQVRIGGAVDMTEAGGPPVMLAVDVDAMSYATASGDRQVIAVGGEGWMANRRLGFRAGARINMVGTETWAVTAGASAGIRAGVFVDGYVVYGGTDDTGWGVAGRASF